MRARRVGICAVGVSLACGGTRPPAAPWPPLPPPEAARVRAVGDVPGEGVVGIGLLGSAIAAVTPAGRVLRFPTGAPPEVFQVPGIAVEDVALDGTSAWLAGPNGVFRVSAVGAVAPVSPDAAVAVAATPTGPCWATLAALRCRRGDADVTVVPDAGVRFADELAAVEDALIWADHGTGEVRVFEAATGSVQTLAHQRGPHAFEAHGAAVVWLESEADLLPGRDAAVTSATRGPGGAWTTTPLPVTSPMTPLVLVDGVVYGAARCSPVARERWTPFDLGSGFGPVAVTPDDLVWTEDTGGGARVLAAPRSACAAP